MSIPQTHPARIAPVPGPAAPVRRPLWRTGAEVLAVLAMTLILTGVLLEIALRLFAPQISSPIPGLFTRDPATQYRLQPGARVPYHFGDIDVTYAVNDQGLRENREVGPPPPGSTRLLCLGDSFTFGEGVSTEQAFPRLLSGSRTAAGSPVDSVNAGVPGYGTDNELAWLRAYGWPLQPRIVVVGFYVGNDVRDVILGMSKTSVDGQGRLVETAQNQQAQQRTAPHTGLKGWLERNSHAYVFLRNLLHPSNTVQQLGLYASGPHEDATFFLKAAPPGLATGWDKTLAILDTMRTEARAHGATLVVVAIPTRDQVEDPYWQEMKKQFGLEEAQLQRDLPERTLAAWSARSGAPLIDLLPGFQARSRDTTLFFNTDPHMNAAGHALTAQLIRDGLARLGLFSP